MLDGEIMPPDFDNALINTPSNTAMEVETDVSDLTPAQKAAIILVSMGNEYAAPIVKKLTDDHIQTFVKALQELREVPRPKMLAVIADFVVRMNGREGMFRGGPDNAMDIARSVLDDDRFARLTMDVSINESQGPTKSGVWAEMDERSATSIAEFIVQQKTEVAAFILSKLANDVVSEVIGELPEDKSVEYVKRLSEDTNVAPFVEQAIEKFVKADFLEVAQAETNSEAIVYVADLLSVMDRERREKILEDIEKEDEDRAHKIRNEMLTFDDLPERLPPAAIQIVFKEYPKKSLLEMLKAGGLGSQMVTEFLYSNISQRMADQIRDEVGALEDMNEKQANKALSSFMSYLGQLQKDERIKLMPKAEPMGLPDLDL